MLLAKEREGYLGGRKGVSSIAKARAKLEMVPKKKGALSIRSLISNAIPWNESTT